MTRWLQVWAWAEEEERSRKLQQAIKYFGVNPADILGQPEVEDELLERYAAAIGDK